MIGFLRGVLAVKRPGTALVDVGGVGYEVSLPLGSYASLPEENSGVSLHIYTHVKEDAIRLYGFLSDEEKQIFTTLLSVNGVGPKLALNILSGVAADAFVKAVEGEDVASLSKIPGVGKKTAGRIILELRQKLPSLGEKKDAVFEDALSALVNLGYRKAEAREALERAAKKGYNHIEELLKEALRELNELQ
jgi:Holliday junction DNA helicase RuvA